MFFCKFVPSLRKKEIDKSGVATIYNKVNISVAAEAVAIFINRDRPRPSFVIIGKAPIPIFLPDGVCQDIEDPFIIKLF